MGERRGQPYGKVKYVPIISEEAPRSETFSRDLDEELQHEDRIDQHLQGQRWRGLGRGRRVRRRCG